MVRVAIGRRFLAVVGTTAATLAVLSCGGGDNVTGTEEPSLLLTEASTKVNGVSVDGQTVRSGENEGALRFEARLMDGRNNPAPGHKVRVEFDIPGMGMMHRTGEFMLHDDGTHGDLVPHDGLYCYEDTSGAYGCHGPNAAPGEYSFEFCVFR